VHSLVYPVYRLPATLPDTLPERTPGCSPLMYFALRLHLWGATGSSVQNPIAPESGYSYNIRVRAYVKEKHYGKGDNSIQVGCGNYS